MPAIRATRRRRTCTGSYLGTGWRRPDSSPKAGGGGRVRRGPRRRQGLELEPGFTAHLASGRTVSARRVSIASGVADELPDIPGVKERWGRDLLHCPYCHGWEVRDQPLGVLGTLPVSVEHAHLVRQWSDDVVFFAHTLRTGPPRNRDGLAARGIEVVDGEVAAADSRSRPADGRRAGRRQGPYIAPRCSYVRGIVPHDDGLMAVWGCAPERSWLPRRSTRPGGRAFPAYGRPATWSTRAPR